MRGGLRGLTKRAHVRGAQGGKKHLLCKAGMVSQQRGRAKRHSRATGSCGAGTEWPETWRGCRAVHRLVLQVEPLSKQAPFSWARMCLAAAHARIFSLDFFNVVPLLLDGEWLELRYCPTNTNNRAAYGTSTVCVGQGTCTPRSSSLGSLAPVRARSPVRPSTLTEARVTPISLKKTKKKKLRKRTVSAGVEKWRTETDVIDTMDRDCDVGDHGARGSYRATSLLTTLV